MSNPTLIESFRLINQKQSESLAKVFDLGRSGLFAELHRRKLPVSTRDTNYTMRQKIISNINSRARDYTERVRDVFENRRRTSAAQVPLDTSMISEELKDLEEELGEAYEELGWQDRRYPPFEDYMDADARAPKGFGAAGRRLDRAYVAELNRQMPTTYPYYVQTTAIVSQSDRTRMSGAQRRDFLKEKRYYKINDTEERQKYIIDLHGRLIQYELGNTEKTWINYLEVDVLTPKGKQQLIRVARYEQGNCLINIIKGALPKDTLSKVLKKCPHLLPTTEIPNPFIGAEDIKHIARISKTNFKIYSKLGALTSQPWEEIGKLAGKKTFHIVFGNGHANVMASHVKIDTIQYLERVDDPEVTGYTDCVDIGYMNIPDAPPECPPDVSYYVRIIDGKFHMFKSYRPSQITKNPADDIIFDCIYKGTAEQIREQKKAGEISRGYTYCVTPDQVLTKIFKRRFDIKPIMNTLIRDIVKKAEHFIGRKRFGSLNSTKVSHLKHKKAILRSFKPKTEERQRAELQQRYEECKQLLDKYNNNSVGFVQCKLYDGYKALSDQCSQLKYKCEHFQPVTEAEQRVKYDQKSLKMVADKEWMDNYKEDADVSYTTDKEWMDNYTRNEERRIKYENLKKKYEKAPAAEAKVLPDSKCKQLDMNKCYVSYKSNPYYNGFPTTDLYPVKGEATNSLFFICNVIGAPDAFKILMQYESGELVLTRPVVMWLRDNGATVTTKYSLVGPTSDVDIVKFADEYKDIVPATALKQFRNSLIGRCISGGIKEAKKLMCRYIDDAERDQLIHEADANGYEFTIDHKAKCITISYKSYPNGAFQFHSFILGYAFTSVANMMQDLIDNDCEIVAYNVDAIVYRGSDPTNLNTAEYGGWKIETPKAGYARLEKTVPVYNKLDPLPDFFAKVNINTYPETSIIIGPPGISKSYPLLVKPYHDQIFLTPRLELCAEHRATQQEALGFNNVFTAHKYFQFTVNDEKWLMLRQVGRIPRAHKIVVVDELNMFNLAEWEVMQRRAKFDGSIIIGLGDFEQICNEIESSAVKRAMFEKIGFKVFERTRTETGIARQSYADGIILDSLRGLSPTDQAEKLKPHVTLVETDAINFDNSMHIANSHKRCHEVNLLAKKWFADNNRKIPCRDRKGKRIELDATDELIWWDRAKMKDHLPKDFKYEPLFSVTADSVQGKTIRCNIYIDDNITRHGAFYTAAARCVSLKQIYLVEEPTDDCPVDADCIDIDPY